MGQAKRWPGGSRRRKGRLTITSSMKTEDINFDNIVGNIVRNISFRILWASFALYAVVGNNRSQAMITSDVVLLVVQCL